MTQVLDAVDFGLILLQPSGCIEFVNRWVRDRCRLEADPVGQPFAQAFNAPLDPRVVTAVRGCLERGNSTRLSQAFHPMPLPLFAPGSREAERIRQAVDIITLGAPAQGGQRRCLIQVRDVSEIVKREQVFRSQAKRLGTELQRLTDAHHEIQRQSLRFREMARLAPVGLFETDVQGRLTFCNAGMAEMLQIDALSLVHRPWTDLFGAQGADASALGQRWQTAAATGVRFTTEVSLQRPGGDTAWMRIESSAIRDSGEAAAFGHIFTLVDVTELHEQARLNELRANHDALTGLANRDRFEARLRELSEADEARSSGMTVMFLDLDGFKSINDTHGHHAGDIVLKTVAARINRCVRAIDMTARIGGDEFAVLLPGALSSETIERIMAKIEKAVAMPINLGHCHARVGVSIGAASLSDKVPDLSGLLRAADSAMYRIKRRRSIHVAAAPPEAGVSAKVA